jgi:hypothetical protein
VHRAVVAGRLPFAVAWAGAVMALLAILAATLTPAAASMRVDGGFLCVLCASASAANLVRNIILFLPLGFFAFGVRPGVWAVTLAGALVSGSVELLQAFVPGRNPLLADLLANTAGAGLGGMIAASLPAWLPPARAPRPLLAGVLAFVVVAAAAPAWLLTPAPPREALFSQWNHSMGRFGEYDGAVLDARIGGLSVPPGRIPDDGDAAGRFLAGDTVRIRLEGGTAVSGARGLLRILSASDDRELVALAVAGTDVRASTRYRADAVGLARPRVLAPEILAGTGPGDTVVLTLRLGDDGGLQVAGPGGEWDGAGNDPSMGWSLLYFPQRTGPRGRAALGFLWCAALLFVPAFLVAGRAAASVAGSTLLLILAGTPAAAPFLAPLAVAGWAGSMTGWGAGRAARSALERAARSTVHRSWAEVRGAASAAPSRSPP